MKYIEPVKQFIIEHFLFGETNKITDEMSLLENNIIDSTGVLELIGFLEENFQCKVNDDEILPENLDSVLKINAFLEKKLGC